MQLTRSVNPIKYYRRQLNITLGSLTRTLGISQSSLQRYEKGSRSIPADIAAALALELHTSIDIIIKKTISVDPGDYNKIMMPKSVFRFDEHNKLLLQDNYKFLMAKMKPR